jgi:hypothetical protein
MERNAAPSGSLARLSRPEASSRQRSARSRGWQSNESEIRDALVQLDPLWDELFPAEQARIVQLLVERVDIAVDGISIRLRTAGLGSLVSDLGQRPKFARAA